MAVKATANNTGISVRKLKRVVDLVRGTVSRHHPDHGHPAPALPPFSDAGVFPEGGTVKGHGQLGLDAPEEVPCVSIARFWHVSDQWV